MRFEVRIPRDELARTDQLIALAAGGGLRTITFRVPAAGPEVGLGFDEWDDEELLVQRLRADGFTVLASRPAQ
jgi:hypothetical protein